MTAACFWPSSVRYLNQLNYSAMELLPTRLLLWILKIKMRQGWKTFQSPVCHPNCTDHDEQGPRSCWPKKYLSIESVKKTIPHDEYLWFTFSNLCLSCCLLFVGSRLLQRFHQAGRIPDRGKGEINTPFLVSEPPTILPRIRNWLGNHKLVLFGHLLSQFESHFAPWYPWSMCTSLAATWRAGSKV